ncbi:MAG: hypothetical protein WC766_03260 [Patescibacteria group bacterium]
MSSREKDIQIAASKLVKLIPEFDVSLLTRLAKQLGVEGDIVETAERILRSEREEIVLLAGLPSGSPISVNSNDDDPIGQDATKLGALTELLEAYYNNTSNDSSATSV